MKCIQILLLALCLVCFNPYKVQAHGPWKYHPYQIPVYPPYPRYPEFVQQNTKPANICTECLNTWANFAKIFNFPDFSQFGNPNFNNGNIRATRPPSYKPTTTVQPILANTRPAVTDTLQTIRPPVPRRSTVKPAVVQPDASASSRIGTDEINGFISTQDRINAILKTTNAPVTQQSYFTYPGIKNSLNHMEYQLADIRGPPFDGLHLFYPYGR
ncbi:hypothetical protein ACKWTF_004525 [Chironomus riparius]